jgi:transposase-like protein
MKKEHKIYRRYSAEFKIRVILDMRNNHLGYHETVYKYWDVKNSVEAHNYAGRLKLWERIYLEEGEAGFMEEKRGRGRGPGKGRPRKQPLPPDLVKNLIEENQQLRMEIEYIKKLSALVLANERARKNKQK